MTLLVRNITNLNQALDVLDTGRKALPAELMHISIKTFALSLSLDGSEEGDLLFIKHGPCKSLSFKVQAARVQIKDMNSFECSISEEDIT